MMTSSSKESLGKPTEAPPEMVLSVMNLKYSHVQNVLEKTLQPEESAVLENVTFSVESGELMGILAPRDGERRTLMELISNRRRYGEFNGEVLLTQKSRHATRSVDGVSSSAHNGVDFKTEFKGVPISESVAYVPRDAVSLYLPGLTYYEMLSYAARLRMRNSKGLSSADMNAEREKRIEDILNIMNLSWCKDRVIAERPTARGSLGGELRKILIAVEIVALPSVMLLADITDGLDATISSDIVRTLSVLASRGHTVVCSFEKIFPEEVKYFDKITVISRGYCIYSSSPRNVCAHFSRLNFECDTVDDIGEFLLDVANGIERPFGERQAVEADVLQSQFEESDYYDQFRPESSTGNFTSSVLLFESDGVGFGSSLKNAFIAIERAWLCKLKEKEVLKKGFGSSILLSLFFGYLAYGLGSESDYLLALIPFPYSATATTTSVMYISTVVQIGVQALNVHVMYQKQRVFYYERSSGVATLPGFVMATLLTEVPLAALFSLIYSTIIYFMVDLEQGQYNFLWWIAVLQLIAQIGLMTVLMFISVLKHEIAVRDWFLYCLATMIWTGGFMFPKSVMKEWVSDVSSINPIRWVFQSVMLWKWADYPDGDMYLGGYEYGNYHKDDFWMISVYFLACAFVLYVLGFLQFPNTLRRSDASIDLTASRESQVEADLIYARKVESLHKPSIISRDSSFTAGQNLSSQASTMAGEGISRGPRVTFANLAYQVPDVTSPLGKKTIIHPMSGMFDWGRLGVIMGAEGSGKSSLLHILGNQTLGPNAELKGVIYHDDNNVEDIPLLPWQRCAFIEAIDEHFRDLTVQDIMYYAMLLRTDEKLPEEEMEKNITNALELLQLDELKNTKSKKLTEGELRRLTIAEDIVHGPHLILIDEPITSLDPRESSIIMTSAIRELVNQDRTVVVTLHQPSAVVFEVCDTLALLSKGRLIYMGNASDAAKFFIESPTMPLALETEFDNPADFLYNVSANLLRDSKNEIADATRLENSYKCSALYMLQMDAQHMKKLVKPRRNTTDTTGDTTNPLNRLSVSSTEEQAQDDDVEDTDGHEDNWRYVTSVDLQGDGRSRSLSMSRPAQGSEPQGKSTLFFRNLLRKFLIPILTSFQEIRSMNLSVQARKAYVLNRRAFFTLFKREKLVIGTTLMYIYIGVFTCLILKDDHENHPGVATAIYMFGAFLLLVSQIQYVFFLYHNQKVFLKEHARGLYSAFLRWLVEDKPLMLLRLYQGFLYAIIVHEWIGYQGGDRGIFFYGLVLLITIGFTMLVETIVYTLPDLRTAYGSVLSVALLLFVFSGLIFKPDILPSYLSPWVPSISIIRWYAQALFINEFDGNTDAFPTSPVTQGDTAYSAFLSTLGWGGKTKFYCLNMTLINLAVFKILSLLVSWKAVVADKGQRCMRRKEVEPRIY